MIRINISRCPERWIKEALDDVRTPYELLDLIEKNRFIRNYLHETKAIEIYYS